MNIFTGFFAIKKAQRQLLEMETAELQMELEQIKAEKQLVAMEPEECQEAIWDELQLDHAFSRLFPGYKGRSYAECAKTGTLIASLAPATNPEGEQDGNTH